MSSIFQSLSLALACLLTLTSAAPQPLSPSKPYMVRRSPVTNAINPDWPTNVLMLGGAETYGMWVPQDGQWYDVSTINCLDMPAWNYVNCAGVTIGQIGVVSGYGPCTFIGISGWSASVSGDPGSGYTTVGPPQNIVWAWCAADPVLEGNLDAQASSSTTATSTAASTTTSA